MLNTSERLVQTHIRLAFNELYLNPFNACNPVHLEPRSSMRPITELGH